MRDPSPLRVYLTPSSLRRMFIAGAYGITALVAGLLPFTLDLRGWLVLLIAALGAREWRLRPPAALIVRLDGTLALLEDNGASIEAALVNGGYLGARFTSIVCRPLGSRATRCIAILPDMLSADEFRRLRTRLNYASSDVDAGAPASQARASNNAPLSALG